MSVLVNLYFKLSICPLSLSQSFLYSIRCSKDDTYATMADDLRLSEDADLYAWLLYYFF